MTASWPLALIFAAAAAYSLYAFFHTPGGIDSYLADREAHGAHALMNAAMAAMFAPPYSLLVERAIFWLLAIGTLALLGRVAAAIRGRQNRQAGGSAYHSLAMLAMIYAMVLMPADMAGHNHMMADEMAMESATPLPALVLGALFAIDGLLTAAVVMIRPDMVLSKSGGQSAKQLRLAAIPHVIMDAGMAVMLL